MRILNRLKIKRLTKKIKMMQYNRQHQQVNEVALSKELTAYHQLALIYQHLIGNKHFPFAEIMFEANLQQAAQLNDAKAQYQLAQHYLAKGKYRERIEKEGIFDSAHNQRQAKECFAAAIAYLRTADSQGHIQAKRMYGLCYINGWGVPADKEKGLQLVVDSIEQENSWDRVPQIFAAIGLNKPEFFSAIMKHQHKTP